LSEFPAISISELNEKQLQTEIERISVVMH